MIRYTFAKSVARGVLFGLFLSIFIIIIFSMLSCTTAGQIAHLRKMHPEAFANDTTTILTTTTTPGVTIRDSTALHFDTVGVAAILDKYKAHIQPQDFTQIKKEVKGFVKNQIVLPDTIKYYDKSGFALKIWQQNGKLQFKSISPPITNNYNTSVIHQHYPAEEKIPLWLWIVGGCLLAFNVLQLILKR